MSTCGKYTYIQHEFFLDAIGNKPFWPTKQVESITLILLSPVR